MSKVLSKNIDKLKDFLASLNGIFRERERERETDTERQRDRETERDRQTESWCDKTANKNSHLEVPNYFALYKTSKNWKEGGICVYIHKSLKYNVRDDKDIP